MEEPIKCHNKMNPKVCLPTRPVVLLGPVSLCHLAVEYYSKRMGKVNFHGKFLITSLNLVQGACNQLLEGLTG